MRTCSKDWSDRNVDAAGGAGGCAEAKLDAANYSKHGLSREQQGSRPPVQNEDDDRIK